MTVAEFLTLLLAAAVVFAVGLYLGRELGIDKGWKDCRELARSRTDETDEQSGV